MVADAFSAASSTRHHEVRLANAPIVAVEHLTKAFGMVPALADVSLAVAPGEVRCLLGENGAGKSTLCNLLFGVYAPDDGHMFLRGREHAPAAPRDAIGAGIAMVHQHFSLIPTLSVLDNLMLGRARGLLRRAAARAAITAVTDRLRVSLDLDVRVEDIPMSARQMVEIVKCLLSEPALLLLDEPTAVLPVSEIEAFLGTVRRIAAGGCAVILVTHKLAEVAAAADSATVLRHGRLVASSQRPSAEMGQLVAAMIGREAAPLRAVRSMDDAAARPSSAASSAPLPRRDALVLDGVRVADDARSVKLADVTLVVCRGEIVGVAGVEGNGQSELCAVVSGLSRPVSGRAFVGDHEITRAGPKEVVAAGVAIIPEDRHAYGCILDMTVAENLCLPRLDAYTSAFGMVDHERLHADAAALIERYDIRCDGPQAPMRGLSGGNQQKVVLARELHRDGLVFVLAAQPTRGLDVGAVEAVYGHLRGAARAGAGVLLVTTELDELVAVADRIVVMYRGRIAGELRPEACTAAAIGDLMSGRGAS